MEQTPKEYARELVNEFKDFVDPYFHECASEKELKDNINQNAKQCAKIAIKRILDNHAFPCYFKSDLICNVDFYIEALKEVDNL